MDIWHGNNINKKAWRHITIQKIYDKYDKYNDLMNPSKQPPIITN